MSAEPAPRWGRPFPKPLSPRAHRRFDTLAAPGALLLAALLARRDPPAAACAALVAAGEGTAMLLTDYPPPVAGRALSFRQHVAVANVHAGFIAGLALFVPGLARRSRPLLLAMAAVPLLLNALSDVEAGTG